MRKIIIIIILVFILSTGIVIASTSEENPFFAIWKAISNLKDENTELRNKNSELEKKIYCLELIKKTPDKGPGEWININIIEFYKETLKRYEKIKNNSSHPEEQDTSISFYENLIVETKPLYMKYIEECGDL